jgi:hypothetical protein
MPTPTIGRIVHYKLSEQDAQEINRRRADYHRFMASGHKDSWVATGHVGHVGNHVRAGEVYPAMVVRTWEGVNYPGVNLQVTLDGNDTYWATSRVEGEQPGEWLWPAYQPEQDLSALSVDEALRRKGYSKTEGVADAAE